MFNTTFPDTNDQTPSRSRFLWIAYAVIVLLPFLMFYWMMPFVSGKTLGTDYINYHVFHQLDLLFSVKSGSFPLFAPACYYGQSATYPHAQLYHPAGHLLSLLPGFWQGYSLEWLTLFRLITLALCHLFLFRLLRKLNIALLPAFILSMITVYNLRMLKLFWNTVALEAYTGTLFLCAAVGFYYLKPAGRRGPLLIAGATFWLITSDFPPMVFYGLAGTIIFMLTFPFLCQAVSAETKKPHLKDTVRFWGKTGLSSAAGFMLSAAYLLPFFWDYLRNSAGRIDQPYLWAVQWTDTPAGFINNFFLPPGSGFSMFGGSPLFLAAIMAPVVLPLFRVRVPAVIWILFGISIAAFLYMQGDRTPVHYLAWQYVPLVSALRGPGRIALILPILFMMILVWVVKNPSGRGKPAGNGTTLPPLAMAATAAIIMTVIYCCLPEHLLTNEHYSCPYNLHTIPDWVKPVVIAAGIAILGLFSFYFFPRGHNKTTAVLLVALTILQLAVIMKYGPMAIAPREKTPTWEQLLAQKQEAINFQPVYFLNQHAGSRVVVRQLQNYFMEPDLAKIYRRYTTADDIEAVYRRLNAGRQSDEVVVEGFSPEADTPLSVPDYPYNSPDGSPGDCTETADRVKLTYSSYNRLVFSVRAGRPSFFVLSYPCSGHWRARLNENSVPILRANGAAQAIHIPAGDHTIEFRYWSNAAVCGMAISCLTLALLIGLAGIRGRGGWVGYITAAAGLAAAAGLFGLWYGSLYTGDDLGTRYEWHSPSPEAPVNLAFGRPTTMSSHTPGYPWLYNSRLAVNGDSSMASCFFTDKEHEPWWQVDLQKTRQVGKIILYTGFAGDRFNHMPLTVSISEDGRHWRAASIEHMGENGRMELVFDVPEALRHINIKASGKCVLSLNEVKVYHPGPPATTPGGR